MVLIFLRSLVFNVLFYVFLVLWILFAIPTFLMPRRAILTVAGWWAKSSLLLLMRIICGTKVEFRGVEKIPPGPLIVASKHQSMWETFGARAVLRPAALHPQARADMDTILRLVHHEGRDDRH